MASTSGATNSGRGNGREEQALDNAEANEWNEMILCSRPPRSQTTKWRGTLGRWLELVVNYYRPTEVAQRSVIQYRVEICHGNRGIPCSIRRLCRRYFWRAALDHDNRRIFLSPNQLVYDDHSLLFSVEPLRNAQNVPLRVGETFELPPFVYTEWCSLTETNKEVPVKMSIQRTGTLEVGAPLTQASEQFLTLLLTQTPRRPAFEDNGTFVPRKQRWYAENNRIYELPFRGGFCRGITPATVLLRGLQCKMVGDAKGLPIANPALVGSLFARAEFDLIDVYFLVRGEAPLKPNDPRRRALRDYSLSDFQTLQMEIELQGVKLRSRCGPKKNYQLHSIDRRTINDQYQALFRSEALGRDVTILDYYRLRYDYELEFPNLPLFRMRPPERNIYIPMELVTISDEVMRIVRRLQPSDAAKVLETTTVLPDAHFDAVRFLTHEAALLTNETCTNFGVDFGDPAQIQMIHVNGRVLPMPQCTFTLGVDAMSRLPVAVEKPVLVGMVLVDGISPQTCRQALLNLMETCRRKGIRFQEQNPRSFPYNGNDNLVAFLNRLRRVVFSEFGGHYKRDDVAFLLVVCMPEDNPRLYRNVKAYCELAPHGFAIISQFIREQTLRKMAGDQRRPFPQNQGHRGTLGNLALKLNGKLGGVNNRIIDDSAGRWKKFTDPRDPTIFIGIDVTHPPKDEPTQESVAAVVANINDDSTRFAGDIAIQAQQRVEQVDDLARLTYDAIYSFYRHTKHAPKHIVVIRDGVSDSQMDATSAFELSHIGNACRQLAKDYTPTLTYIVVQKRNPTRAKPASDEALRQFQGDYYRTRTNNVPPGTIIDDTITSPKTPNFYLCSHKGLLGTSRIPHYTIVYNTWNALDMDDWQVAMFMQCHLVARSMTPVSIPAPVYYADLLCGRARKHVLSMRDNEGVNYDPSRVKIIECLKKEQFFL